MDLSTPFTTTEKSLEVPEEVDRLSLEVGLAGAFSAARLQETPDFPDILRGERPTAATTQNCILQPRKRLLAV